MLVFLTEHWLLVVAFVVVLILLIVEEVRAEQSGGGRLSPQAAIHLINRDNAVVVDVRDEAAFAQGHIVKAVHVALSALDDSVKKLTKYKDKPVILVCQKGQQSRVAAKKLAAQGFVRVSVLSGGIKAWKDANYPLTKK